MEGTLKCYLCQGQQGLVQYDNEDGICRRCYDQQAEQCKYYRSLKVINPEIDHIVDNIYLGNEDAAISKEFLDQRQITAICVCGKHLDTPFESDPKFIYFKLPLDDFPKQNITQYFDEHYRWMRQMTDQNRKILLHCAAGISRSASFTIAFLMKDRNWTFEQSKQLVKSKRKWINPNSGFRDQLLVYETHILAKKQKQ